MTQDIVVFLEKHAFAEHTSYLILKTQYFKVVSFVEVFSDRNMKRLKAQEEGSECYI